MTAGEKAVYMMKVSVIIPVFNAELYVAQAVASALEQPETGEVVLVEDGSRDNSCYFEQPLHGEKLRYF
jgi:glycosyltransferase involved in cell wall biosynthesis